MPKYEPDYDPSAGPEVRESYIPYEGVEGAPVLGKGELRKLPKKVLLRIAIELDPDTVASSFQEGWTKDDILRVIERHVKTALGNQAIEGWPYIQEVEIFDSEVEEG